MDDIKELVSKYRWWVVGAVIVGLVMWNNYGVAEARVENASAETTEQLKKSKQSGKKSKEGSLSPLFRGGEYFCSHLDGRRIVSQLLFSCVPVVDYIDYGVPFLR